MVYNGAEALTEALTTHCLFYSQSKQLSSDRRDVLSLLCTRFLKAKEKSTKVSGVICDRRRGARVKRKV